jgi:hypothetical protein
MSERVTYVPSKCPTCGTKIEMVEIDDGFVTDEERRAAAARAVPMPRRRIILEPCRHEVEQITAEVSS